MLNPSSEMVSDSILLLILVAKYFPPPPPTPPHPTHTHTQIHTPPIPPSYPLSFFVQWGSGVVCCHLHGVCVCVCVRPTSRQKGAFNPPLGLCLPLRYLDELECVDPAASKTRSALKLDPRLLLPFRICLLLGETRGTSARFRVLGRAHIKKSP